MSVDVALIASIVLVWALVSRHMGRTPVSPAMFFVVVGVLIGNEVLDIIELGTTSSTIRLLAELTLAVVLFSDASQLNARALRHEWSLPARFLAVGLPLTIVVGGLLGMLMFPGLLVAEAFILAILLAPTDAALGQAVVSDERLPSRLRQGLNVESGLNDGICVPLLFAAIAFADVEADRASATEVFTDMVEELAIAIGTGAAVAVVVAVIYRRALAAGWIEARWNRLVPVATTLAAYALTAEFGGSGFIASFVAGLTFGIVVGHEAVEHAIEFTEEIGDLLSAVTFLLFAAVFVGPSVREIDAIGVLYAVLALTVIRMVPVAVAMLGTGARRPTVAFAGWFGPRGLATIVFLLTVVEEAALPGTARITEVATVTVVLSVLLHGVTALPLTSRYVSWWRANPRPDATTPVLEAP